MTARRSVRPYHQPGRTFALVAATSLALGLGGPAQLVAAATPDVTASVAPVPASATVAAAEDYADDYADAVSAPVEDPSYPGKGDPRVDALHYGLALHWSARQHLLRGRATIELRVAEETDTLVLDLAHA